MLTIHSRGPPENFRKIYTENNFSTVEPILTNKIPIDSAQQVEECRNIKSIRNIILGKQTGHRDNKTLFGLIKLLLTITLQPSNRLFNRPTDFPNNIPIDSARHVEKK
jgi:hypothetical protein